jgi:hypothetical protein
MQASPCSHDSDKWKPYAVGQTVGVKRSKNEMVETKWIGKGIKQAEVT